MPGRINDPVIQGLFSGRGTWLKADTQRKRNDRIWNDLYFTTASLINILPADELSTGKIQKDYLTSENFLLNTLPPACSTKTCFIVRTSYPMNPMI